MNFKLTPEQEAVCEAIARRSGSVMVEAGAGCAKTTTLERAARGVRVPALALAFNKSIATEMARKFPSNFECKTMNGLGHGAWSRALGGKKLELSTNKLGKLINDAAGAMGVRKLSSEQWGGAKDLTTRAMTSGLVLADDPCAGAGLVEDTPDAWMDLALAVGVAFDEAEGLIAIAREALRAGVALARQGIVSFDDQIYCSVLLGGKFPEFPCVFVDENQDLSPMNHAMLSKCLRRGGRLVAVGDRHQAIYGFRGASGDSAERIRGLLPVDEWTDLPLMTTFRCPKAVVARQQEHVPGYRAADAAPDGVVLRLRCGDDPGLPPSWGLRDITEAALAAPSRGSSPSIAVLCRNNAPLLSLAFKLIKSGTGVVMLGREIGKGLVKLSERLSPDDRTGIAAHAGAIAEWRDREIAVLESAGRPEVIAGVVDRADCLLAVAGTGLCRDAGELRAAIERLFARETGLLTLASIHKAKGLEWDLVLHLDPWRVPSERARRRAREGHPAELRQELNLRYVAETRTRHTLLMASLEDFAE